METYFYRFSSKVTIVLNLVFAIGLVSYAQDQLQVDGDASILGKAAVGLPGAGNILLDLKSERNWVFRQKSSGAETALELASIGGGGNKSFYLTTTGDFVLGGNTISINGLEVANLGGTNLGLDGDIVPYGGSFLAFDIGNNTSTEHWDDVVASDFVTYSDINVKQNISTMVAGLPQILGLHRVQFQYKKMITPDNRTRYGLVAQEVEKILPSLIIDEDVDIDPETGQEIRTPSEYKCINYMELIPVLIQAIQDENKYVDSLEKRIQILEAKNLSETAKNTIKKSGN